MRLACFSGPIATALPRCRETRPSQVCCSISPRGINASDETCEGKCVARPGDSNIARTYKLVCTFSNDKHKPLLLSHAKARV